MTFPLAIVDGTSFRAVPTAGEGAAPSLAVRDPSPPPAVSRSPAGAALYVRRTGDLRGNTG